MKDENTPADGSIYVHIGLIVAIAICCAWREKKRMREEAQKGVYANIEVEEDAKVVVLIKDKTV